MKYRVLNLVIIGSIFNFAFSADIDSLKTHRLEKESRAIQFRINDNFNLSSFQGSVISYKKHITEQNAYRIGISLSKNFQSEEGNKYYDLWSKDTLYNDTESSINNIHKKWGFAIMAQWLKYSESNYGIFTFFGVGPKATYTYFYSENETRSLDSSWTDLNYHVIESNIINIGMTCTLGVEWFFRNNMSLHSEYLTTYTLGKRKYSIEDINEDYLRKRVTKEKTETPINSLSSSVEFGLSIYF